MINLKELYLTYPVENLFYELVKDLIIKNDNIILTSYYNKDNILIFEYNKETNWFWCSYNFYWVIFEKKFNFNWQQICDLTIDMVKKIFKLKKIIPDLSSRNIIIDKKIFNNDGQFINGGLIYHQKIL